MALTPLISRDGSGLVTFRKCRMEQFFGLLDRIVEVDIDLGHAIQRN